MKFFSVYPFISRLCLWVFLPLLLVISSIVYILLLSLPSSQGVKYVKSILTDTTIEYSQTGIPRIKSSTDNDVFFALGFCHAQNRLWQMEINRRIAFGRLSEVFGEPTLESDKFFRILGLERNARKVWEHMSEKDKNILVHYSEGVNEGIRQAKVLPMEFLLNGFSPENWTPIDSISMMQLMAWYNSANIGAEIRRMLLLQRFGIDKTNQLMPAFILPDFAALTSAPIMASIDRSLWASELTPKKYIGSNGWVIAGRLTESGFPILANDPHIATSLPSAWYLADLHGANLNVTGATLPGLPFVVIGRNKHIAWGITNLMADTQDLILEKINPINANQYELNGVFQDMEISKEIIKIRKNFLRPVKPPHTLTVRRTINGPLISDIETYLNGFSYSLRWAGDDEDGGTISSFIKLNYASNWDEFNQSLSNIVAPSSYFVYADRQGNIGSSATGKIPIRRFGNGAIPSEGWLHDRNWSGWIPFSELPRKYNPVEGYIIAANHRVTTEGYPYHITSDWNAGDRALRIDAELKKFIDNNTKIKEKDMLDLQLDFKSAYFNDIYINFSKVLPKKKQHEDVLKLLREWDGNMDTKTVGGTILQVWKFHLQKIALEDDVNEIRGVEDVAIESNPRIVRKILNGEAAYWCDYKKTPEAESCEDLKYIALDSTIAELSSRLGGDPTNWQWGKIHKKEFPHFPYAKNGRPLGGFGTDRPFLSYFFHRELPAGGDDTTVNIGPFSGYVNSRYSQYHAASYRQIIDMNSDSEIRFEQMTGQSGNILSENFDDGIVRDEKIQSLIYEKLRYKEKLTLSPLNKQ